MIAVTDLADLKNSLLSRGAKKPDLVHILPKKKKKKKNLKHSPEDANVLSIKRQFVESWSPAGFDAFWVFKRDLKVHTVSLSERNKHHKAWSRKTIKTQNPSVVPGHEHGSPLNAAFRHKSGTSCVETLECCFCHALIRGINTTLMNRTSHSPAVSVWV